MPALKVFSPLFGVLTVAVCVATSLTPTVSQAQSLRDVIDALLQKHLGDKAKQLIGIADATPKSKSLFAGKSWTFRDASGAEARVTAFANEVCVEQLKTPNRVCSDYNGRETSRAGYALMPPGTGETARIYVEGGRIVVESDRIECTTGQKVVWATAINLISSNQPPVSTTAISNGGLGGCS